MTRGYGIIVAACVVILLPTVAAAGGKTVHVKGYTRKDGTYVAPHTRSSGRSDYRGGGVAISAPSLPAPTLPKDVPVKGHYRADGTYVEPHMRHIDGIKDPESWGSGRGSKHRTAARTTARGLVSKTKPKTRFPTRDWKSPSGKTLAHGRMGWQAMDKLHVEKDDGTFVDLNVSDLSEDDANWLEAARKRPWAMKTEVVESGAADDDESDQAAESDAEAAEAEADAPQ